MSYHMLGQFKSPSLINTSIPVKALAPSPIILTVPPPPSPPLPPLSTETVFPPIVQTAVKNAQTLTMLAENKIQGAQIAVTEATGVLKTAADTGTPMSLKQQIVLADRVRAAQAQADAAVAEATKAQEKATVLVAASNAPPSPSSPPTSDGTSTDETVLIPTGADFNTESGYGEWLKQQNALRQSVPVPTQGLPGWVLPAAGLAVLVLLLK